MKLVLLLDLKLVLLVEMTGVVKVVEVISMVRVVEQKQPLTKNFVNGESAPISNKLREMFAINERVFGGKFSEQEQAIIAQVRLHIIKEDASF